MLGNSIYISNLHGNNFGERLAHYLHFSNTSKGKNIKISSGIFLRLLAWQKEV